MVDSFLRVILDTAPRGADYTAAALRSAHAPLVLARRFVVDQNFALFAVTARFVLGRPDDREDALGLVEDGVHLLKRAIGRLRIEEKYDGDDESVAGMNCQPVSSRL